MTGLSALRLVPTLILLLAGAFIPGCRPVRPTDGGPREARLSARPGSLHTSPSHTLFSRIIAFSPGFIPGGPRRGAPAVFVSHGRSDDVLPVQVTARKIVPALESDGYRVTYREFDGGHEVPPRIARQAVAWLGW